MSLVYSGMVRIRVNPLTQSLFGLRMDLSDEIRSQAEYLIYINKLKIKCVKYLLFSQFS